MHRMLSRLWLLALPAFLVLAACDSHDHDHGGHANLGRVVIETRPTTSAQTIAEWRRGQGWVTNNVPALTVAGEAENFGRASWTVRMFDGAGNEIAMEGGRDANGNRVCLTPYSARYAVTGDAVFNPGNAVTVNVGGAAREVFHCDHIHVYPRQAGTAQLRLLLWHNDHDDAATDPLSIQVNAAPLP